MKRTYCKIVLIALLIGSGVTLAAWRSAVAIPVILDHVPAYNWYHGCGLTAAASVIGYWDLHNYDNLFDASGWEDVRLTQNVKDHISSPEHNAKYDPKPDDPHLPDPPNTSIADFFHTSEGSLNYGWSYLSYADDAFIGYADHRGYEFDARNEWFDSFAWDDFTAEIDEGRPLLFLVDTNADSTTDHFVPVMGYDNRGAEGLWYALYTTWSENEDIVWHEFRGMSNVWTWGIGYATIVNPIDPPPAPVPETSTVLLLSAGLLAAAGFTKRCEKK